ncbi:MAG: hypothetical protein ABR543_10865, partial [Gemmatimonadaceae bacterium]
MRVSYTAFMIVAATAVVSGCATSQKVSRIEVDQGKRMVVAVRPPEKPDTIEKRDTIKSGGSVRVPSKTGIPITAVSSNSAFYTCSAKQKTVSVPELDSLKAFLTALGPYATSLLTEKIELAPELRTGTLDSAATRRLNELKQALVELDTLLVGSKGLQATRALTLRELESMRGASVTAIHASRDSVRKFGNLDCPRCTRLKLIQQLADQFQLIGEKLRSVRSDVAVLGALVDTMLRAAEAAKPGADTREAARLDSIAEAARDKLDLLVGRTTDIIESAQEALNDSDKIIAVAYATEALTLAAANATVTIDCDTVSVSLAEGREVALTVASQPNPELSRLASEKPFEFTMTILPEWRVRPVVGLALVGAWDARYPTFGIKDSAGMKVVAETGEQDSRYTYGLTLGLAPWFL